MTNSNANPPPTARQWLVAVLAIAALIGFIASFVVEMIQIWRGAGSSNKNLDYLASGLAGLVGGIVAIGLGQKPLHEQAKRSAITGLSGILNPSAPSRTGLAVLYAIAYFLVGFAAIVTWISRSAESTAAINSFAVSFLGLVTAVVTAFFSNP